tara:strand:+ start:830 stop:1207 length:378 start_codon:yes stop_codon:yes gene_type:complete
MLEHAITSLPDELGHQVTKILGQRLFDQQTAAFEQQKQIAVDNNDKSYRRVDGLGELKASIPPAAYHYWGNRLGYECWGDKKFMHEYLRDTPEARVNTHSDKCQVGYDGDGFIRHRAGRKIKVYK